MENRMGFPIETDSNFPNSTSHVDLPTCIRCRMFGSWSKHLLGYIFPCRSSVSVIVMSCNPSLSVSFMYRLPLLRVFLIALSHVLERQASCINKHYIMTMFTA